MLALGASPRAAVCLLRVAQAFAAFEDRDYLIPDDVKRAEPHPVDGDVAADRDRRRSRHQMSCSSGAGPPKSMPPHERPNISG